MAQYKGRWYNFGGQEHIPGRYSGRRVVIANGSAVAKSAELLVDTELGKSSSNRHVPIVEGAVPGEGRNAKYLGAYVLAIGSEPKVWILTEGSWADAGGWADGEAWQDGPI